MSYSGMVAPRAFFADSNDIEFGNPWWFVYAGVSCFLVLFAGIMSGLTLGLMSLGLVELEILQRSGSSTEKRQAAVIFPVVQKQHQLLVTLLLCNAAAMEALPLYLDKLFHPVVAVILSVTFVLAFGEIIPQSLCSRYGLAVGANFVWLVRILMIICFPIAYPIGKILDSVLGHQDALFRRPQLKALVTIHSQEAGRGGELSHAEATIINGALDLTEKTAEEAMTPIESTFSLDVNTKLNWEAIGKILARGHSRIPVYSGNPKNLIGLLLVKNLLTVRAETETPVSSVSIRRMPRVPADMPLYDILNEFQKGGSHMAAVVKVREKEKKLLSSNEMGGEKVSAKGDSQLTIPLLDKHGGEPNTVVVNIDKSQQNGFITYNSAEDGEVIGIITLEDVFEELLQEEIVDETDVYVDVHKRIRVVAAAAASSVVRAPSNRRLQKPSTDSDMGFKKVYVSLSELFPQVDARALRAVAIEHSKDVDAAVVAVLEEIIPFFTERTMPSSPLSKNVSVGESSEGCSSERKGQAPSCADDGPSAPIHDACDGPHEGENNTAELKMNANKHSQGGSLLVIAENRVDCHHIEISGDSQIEKTVSADVPQPTMGMLLDADVVVSQKMDNIQENKGIADGTAHDISASTSGGSSAQLVEEPDMLGSDLDSSKLSLSTDTAINGKNMSNIIGTDDESTMNATVSSQIRIVDVIEELIADARNNKKTLFLEMESVINLIKQVEVKEQAAEQAKTEAAAGGTDLLGQVEELKRMLQHAKEANDMHAGEVYGEKAILATELRELQSRVHSLSDERDKSLAVVDEMRQSLEARLAAAVNELKSAELKKLEKEEVARKSLAEQELIMEKVVQESKILRQQAEDNAKLEEFLLDRGRVVDTLQGEIAVICQDVKLLKEKFDQHVPLGKSLFSSQTSFILASSSSSLKSLVPEQVENVAVGEDENIKDNHEKAPEDEAVREDCKALVEDGWEFFDSSETNVPE
ncbi:CBS domain protein with a domain protein [Perilla frutescens var. hirtella]|nr:CBS domain protein with a domain protein [Perilla frutescens var. frutescens]KAH6793969.1 CBS domain protein with a domain protein [Perilla frutescens var. hirtella]